MKKIFFAVFLMISAFSVVSCTTPTESTTTTLVQVQNAQVVDGIFQCDDVDGYSDFEITINSGTMENSYLITQDFNLNYVLDNGDYTATVRAVKLENGSITEAGEEATLTFGIDASLKTNTLTESNLNNDAYVRYMGRTMYDDTSKSTHIYYTGAGFEVGFYGTSVTATFVSTNTSNLSKQPYIMIFVDGNLNPTEGTTMFLFAETVTWELASNLEEGYHTVTVVKRSESTDNLISLSSVTTDGSFATPPAAKSLSIQYIGASTMTGYGNMASGPSVSKTTENSNGMLAYTSLAAYYLGADYSIVAASGWGLTRGWNTGGVVDEVRNIPNAYDYVAIDTSGQVLTEAWNPSNFVPDVFVISLGSNDYNTSGYSTMSTEQQTAFISGLYDAYLAFAMSLHEDAPNASIFLTYNFLSVNPVLEQLTLDVVAALTLESINAHAVQLTTGGTLDIPFGSDYHPGVGTHLMAADELALAITTYTDYERVNDSISLE